MAGVTRSRPFYNSFAWAYDHVIPPPSPAAGAAVATVLAEASVPRGARVVDAGCGTGGYSIALARHGFEVVAIDSSEALLSEARKKAMVARVAIEFDRADLTKSVPPVRASAVLCRGVLNDLVTDDARDAALENLGRMLCAGGVLVLDVRDWTRSVARYRRDPIFEREARTARGLLQFRSETTLVPERQSLQIRECFRLHTKEGVETAPHDFVMRCWSREELETRLPAAGFVEVEVITAFGLTQGRDDRLVAVARRARS